MIIGNNTYRIADLRMVLPSDKYAGAMRMFSVLGQSITIDRTGNTAVLFV